MPSIQIHVTDKNTKGVTIYFIRQAQNVHPLHLWNMQLTWQQCCQIYEYFFSSFSLSFKTICWCIFLFLISEYHSRYIFSSSFHRVSTTISYALYDKTELLYLWPGLNATRYRNKYLFGIINCSRVNMK